MTIYISIQSKKDYQKADRRREHSFFKKETASGLPMDQFFRQRRTHAS